MWHIHHFHTSVACLRSFLKEVGNIFCSIPKFHVLQKVLDCPALRQGTKALLRQNPIWHQLPKGQNPLIFSQHFAGCTVERMLLTPKGFQVEVDDLTVSWILSNALCTQMHIAQPLSYKCCLHSTRSHGMMKVGPTRSSHLFCLMEHEVGTCITCSSFFATGPRQSVSLARTFQLAFRWGKSIFPADLGQKHATRDATGKIQLNVRHVWQQRASLSSASERLSFFSLSLGSLSWGTWTYTGEYLRFPALFEKPGQQIGKLDLCKQE